MDVKKAVEAAKAHVMNVLGAELSDVPTTQEVWFDSKKREWCITLGILRGTSPVAGLRLPEYKTVRLKETDGSLVSIRSREYSRV